MSDTNWTRSSFWRDGDACIEVRRDGDMVLVRDGDLGDDSREMVWSPGGWRDLIDALVNGEDSLWVIPASDRGGVHFGVGDSLHFEEGAWNSFVAGVKAGEFDVDRLSTPVPVSEGSQVSGEVGPASGVVAGSNQIAATGAGNGGVVPVPVAAQPPQISGEMLEAFAVGFNACPMDASGQHPACCTKAGLAAALRVALRDPAHQCTYAAVYFDAQKALDELLGPDEEDGCGGGMVADIWHLARRCEHFDQAAKPEPAWGSGPLVDHNPETPKAAELPLSPDEAAAEVTLHPLGCSCTSCADIRRSVAS